MIIKKSFLLLWIFLFISCSKETIENKKNRSKKYEVNKPAAIAEEKTIFEEFFVNAMESVEVKKEPDIDSITIGTLKHKEKIIVIEKKHQTTVIGEYEGAWKKIKSDNITGWVFDVYLETNTDIIDSIQLYSGTYNFTSIDIKKQENYNLTEEALNIIKNTKVEIKYLGKKKIKINLDFEKQDYIRHISYKDLKQGYPFINFGGETGGLSDEISLYFIKDDITLKRFYHAVFLPGKNGEPEILKEPIVLDLEIILKK